MKHSIVLALIFPLLTACGGGGSSEPPVGPFSAVINSMPDRLAESNSASVTVAVQNVKTTANVSMTSSIPGLMITAGAGNTFTLKAAEVDRDLKAQVTWIATDGTDQTRRVTGSFDINIENTSFLQTLAEIEFLQSMRERLVGAQEEKALLVALEEILTLVNPDDKTNAGSVLPNDALAELLSGAISGIQVQDYKLGTVGDSQVIENYTNALLTLDQHLTPYKVALNNQLKRLEGQVPAVVQAEQFVLNPTLKTASFFTGNPLFGQVVGDAWRFNDNLAYLNDIASTTCGL